MKYKEAISILEKIKTPCPVSSWTTEQQRMVRRVLFELSRQHPKYFVDAYRKIQDSYKSDPFGTPKTKPRGI